MINISKIKNTIESIKNHLKKDCTVLKSFKSFKAFFTVFAITT